MMEARAILAWPVLMVQLLIFGTAAFTLTLGAEIVASNGRVIQSFIVFWRGLTLVNLVTSPLVLLEMVSEMAAQPWSHGLAFVSPVLGETQAGHVWCWRLSAVAILAIAAWIPARPFRTSSAMLMISGALLLAASLTSHSIDKGPLAVGMRITHEAAAGVWGGAIVGLWLGALVSEADNEWITQVTPWVSQIAGWSVATIVATGGYLAYTALGVGLERLTEFAWGRILLTKVACFILVVAIGGYNRYRLVPAIATPSRRRALLLISKIETTFLVGVVGLASPDRRA
jgi:putative copper export protein